MHKGNSRFPVGLLDTPLARAVWSAGRAPGLRAWRPPGDSGYRTLARPAGGRVGKDTLMRFPWIPPEMLRFVTMGMEFFVTFGIFLAAGILLDRPAHGGVVWTLVGMVVGFCAAFYRLLRAASQYNRQYKKDDRPPRKP